MKTLALVFTTLLSGCLAGTAQATTPVAKDLRYEVVGYADLNLANEADAAILLQRIKAAAVRVCGRDVDLSPLDFYYPDRRCAKAATDRAMADVNTRSAVLAYVRP
jgi:UrcA family protein